MNFFKTRFFSFDTLIFFIKLFLFIPEDLIGINKVMTKTLEGGLAGYFIFYFVFIFIYLVYIYNYKYDLFAEHIKYFLIACSIKKTKSNSLVIILKHTYQSILRIKFYFILLSIKFYFFSPFSFLLSILIGILFAFTIPLWEHLGLHLFYIGFCLGIFIECVQCYIFYSCVSWDEISKFLSNLLGFKKGEFEDFILFFTKNTTKEEAFFEVELFIERLSRVFCITLALLIFLYFLLLGLCYLEEIFVFKYAHSSYFYEDWLLMKKEALESLAERGFTLEDVYKKVPGEDFDPEILDYIKRFDNRYTFYVYQNEFLKDGLFFCKLFYFLDCFLSGMER